MKHFCDIPSALSRREQQALLRKRVVLQSAQTVTPTIDGQSYLSFCSNDYLGLANHPSLIEKMKTATEEYGVGAGASHLVSGHHQEHELLERELAAFCGREAALVFSSGYMANIGIMAALMTRQDTILQDKLNHASLIDGATLAQSSFVRYQHLDVDHLHKRLEGAKGKKLIVTDGVFSMDGDCAPLNDIARLAAEYDAWVLVDDAHGFGFLGPEGSGLVKELGLKAHDIQLSVGTLGKAFGTSGAFVAGDRSTIEYILQFARSYIYTTALPPAIAATTRTALQLVRQADTERVHLKRLIARLRTGLLAQGHALMESKTPIQPILIGGNDDALRYSQLLKDRGILVTAIRPPTVPEGTARLRITLSAAHTEQQVDQLLNAMDGIR